MCFNCFEEKVSEKSVERLDCGTSSFEVTMALSVADGGVSVRLSYNGVVEEFFVLCLADIVSRIAAMGVMLNESKLILSRGGVISGKELHEACETEETDVMEKLAAAKKVMLIGPKQADVANVRAMKEDTTIRGFEQELVRARQRVETSASTSAVSKGGKRGASGTPHFFGSIKVLSLQSYQNNQSIPTCERAHQLLIKLATDPAILQIMKTRHWNVGVLSELPPLGKVGVSPACLLGLNKNNGQEICLRIRTDDLKGFRRYDVIIDTLLHELTHNVYSDHDNNFKMLNSELKKEYKQFHMAHIVNRLEEGASGGGSIRWEDSELDENNEIKKSQDGRKLGRRP